MEGVAVRIERTGPYITKGWYWGPWYSNLDISVGFANKGVDEPHFHRRMTEIYLIACGTAEMRVETESINLSQGQVIVVEPGEAHTFLSCSPDHFHFVLQVPGLEGEEARFDKVLVPRSRLGL
jgi:mannose-6-phosphate isomerase-like protein (cupin superfamily)